MIERELLAQSAALQSALPDWVRLSQNLGAEILLTQASGGNVSVKLDDDRMLIKASGTRLGEASATQGWAVANYRGILFYLPSFWELSSPEEREMSYKTLLHRATLTRGRITSVEASMHAVIPQRWVAHTHSVVGQLLGLLPREECRRTTADILGPQVHLHHLPPCTPGLDLSRAMAAGLREEPAADDKKRPHLWFLENHGLSWGADEPAMILQSSGALERPLRKAFGLERFPPPQPVSVGPLEPFLPPTPPGRAWHGFSFKAWPRCRFGWEPLFPDFVSRFNVWGDGAADLIKIDPLTAFILARDQADLRDRADVLYVHALLSTIAHERGVFRPLPLGMIRHIKDMLVETSISPSAY